MSSRPDKPPEYFKKLLEMREDEIDYSDIPATTAADWEDAEVIFPTTQTEVRPDEIPTRKRHTTGAVVPRGRPWAWNLDEKNFAEQAYEALKQVNWARGLIRAIDAQGGISPENSSLLWEMRFAYELYSRGIVADYEYHTGIGSSTIDFHISDHFEWLIELVEIGESVRAAEATAADEQNFSRIMRTSQGKSSDEGEMVLIEQKIVGKMTTKRGKPTKFPKPSGAICHVLIADLCKIFPPPDDEMLVQLAYGPKGLTEPLAVMRWEGNPIRGLFEPGNPLRGADLLRQRVHLIGFYQGGDLAKDTSYLANPYLMPTRQAAEQTFEKYPLASDIETHRRLAYRSKSLWQG